MEVKNKNLKACSIKLTYINLCTFDKCGNIDSDGSELRSERRPRGLHLRRNVREHLALVVNLLGFLYSVQSIGVQDISRLPD